MKHIKSWSFLLVLLFCLCACGTGNGTDESQSVSASDETTESTGKQESQKPEDLHTPFYIEGLSADQVVKYFAEVVLDAEYSTGEGNVHVVQKWTAPIRFTISGEATQADRDKLETLFAQLNAVEGFPGIEAAIQPIAANLMLNFYNREDFQTYFGRIVNYEDADGAVEYWYYNETNSIYTATVGYRTDIEQYTRNSVLLEEVINGLGITDTNLREDSITYQGFSQTQELSEIDWLIVRLLYHPDIKCGMDLEQCREVIEKLYY
ncbi:MAG: DUF2927 domain-containing protein [Oscillospiraceae bacterium]|nr:DUF2927 domain-containing protein [Oscillospiraceae bacterium]